MKFFLFLVLFIKLHLFSESLTLRSGISYRKTQKLLSKSKPEKTVNDKKPEVLPKIGFAQLFQLITMGAGAPSLGEYKGTDPNGKMFFELDANNFLDSDGNSLQTKQKYFNDGYVEEDTGDKKPPGFWANLVSGGKLQQEWEKDIKN